MENTDSNSKTKRIFLVDFENVHISGLRGIKMLSERDEIILLYSDKGEDSISVIKELREDIQYAKIVKNGQNALDFQLSSYLGFIINKAVCEETLADTQFFIISKDSGYDCVIGFWTKTVFVKHLNINPNISRAENIQKALTPTETNSSVAVKSVVEVKPVAAVKPIIAQQEKINEIMKRVKALNEFHSALVKEFGMPQGGALYKENKEKFKENIQKSSTPPKTKPVVAVKTINTQQQKINEIMKREKTLTGFNNELGKAFGNSQGSIYRKNVAEFKKMHNLK
jgi:hypothetical protein